MMSSFENVCGTAVAVVSEEESTAYDEEMIEHCVLRNAGRADVEEDEESDLGPAPGEKILTVSLQLSSVEEAALCRRGRFRFHEIQANHPNAKVRFDRRKKALKVVGSQTSVDSVRRQLQALGGGHKEVPTAVWYELLRTRTEEDAAKSLVQRVQEQSGCRIHIERGQREVRIFGADEDVEVAARLIDEFAESCSERRVQVAEGHAVSPSTLQCIAESCEVTITLQKDCVMIYGLEEKVNNAAVEVEIEFMGEDCVETEDEFEAPASICTCSFGLDSWRSLSRRTSSSSLAASEGVAPAINVVPCSSAVSGAEQGLVAPNLSRGSQALQESLWPAPAGAVPIVPQRQQVTCRMSAGGVVPMPLSTCPFVPAARPTAAGMVLLTPPASPGPDGRQAWLMPVMPA